MIVEDFGVYEQISQGEYLGNNVVGCLNSEMKDIHIISFTIHQKSSVILHEEERSDCPETEIVGMLPSRTQFSDVVKIALNLDVNNENEALNWDKNLKDTDFSYADISLLMKNCIQYFNLDPKQTAAFTVICSSFMLTYLNDPTISKYGSQVEKENATRILFEKGAKSRLIMHLTGSGGSGKSFVLKAIKSFCQHFCKAIGQPCDESVFIISATTNTAAVLVQGDTIHSLAGLGSKLSNIIRTGKINWRIAKVLFIDEMSMLDIKDFLKLDKYLRHFMAQYNPEALNFPFGGFHIVLFNKQSSYFELQKPSLCNRSCMGGMFAKN